MRLSRLDTKRVRSDLIQTFKIMNSGDDINSEYYCSSRCIIEEGEDMTDATIICLFSVVFLCSMEQRIKLDI